MMGIEHETSERSPETAEIIRRANKNDRLDFYCMLPGAVTRYDASTQQVDVQPLIKDAHVDENDERQTQSFPVVPACAVQFMGAGGFRLTCPISDGTLIIDGATIPATTGMLIFCDRSMDAWLAGKGAEVDPGIDHDHAITDAVFVPGLMPFGAPWGSCPTDHMTLGADGGVQIHLRGQTIIIGDESGSQFLSLGQKADDNFTTFWNLISQFFGSGATIINEPGNGAPSALQAALLAYVAAQVIALKLPPPSTQAAQAKGK